MSPWCGASWSGSPQYKSKWRWTRNVRQKKVSLPPHSPAAVPPRKYAPKSIARLTLSRTHPPSLSVSTTLGAPPPRHSARAWYGQLLQMPLSRAAVARHQSF